VIDLLEMYGQNDYSLAYLVASVYSPEAVKGYSFYLGSDDYAKIWVNGQHVYTFAGGPRAVLQDDDKVEGIALAKGWNRILVKCVNLKSGWGLMLRIADQKDRPVITACGGGQNRGTPHRKQ
jgi:hypothetical protein